MFFSSKRSRSRNFRKFSWISLSACRPQTRLYNVHFAYHYQAAELEQSRWTSDVIVVTCPVSMGTWASLPPEVFVVVDGVKSPISVLFRAMSGALEIRFCVSQRLDKVNLIVHAHKPPVVETDERLNSLTQSMAVKLSSQTELSQPSLAARSHLLGSSSCIASLQPTTILWVLFSSYTQYQMIIILAKHDKATW